MHLTAPNPLKGAKKSGFEAPFRGLGVNRINRFSSI
jgi:hypothetical protein